MARAGREVLVMESRRKRNGSRQDRGFTLIELLVVVAIIALLISILLPSLNGARRSARAVKCAANLHDVGQAFALYLTENRGYYPPSYVYPSDFDGACDFDNQDGSHPNGYAHWSWFLYNHGAVGKEVFTCPEMPGGGHPRTNPGADPASWQATDQADQDSVRGMGPGRVEDKQAPRMAYTANALVVPRNKFTASAFSGDDGSPGERFNRLVTDGMIKSSRPVVLVTEFNKDWMAISINNGGSYVCKSHRPINPLYNIGSGWNEYHASAGGGFRYTAPSAVDFGLRPLEQLEGNTGIINGDFGSEVNAVGRHHPGHDKLGGTTNFLYVDGSVVRKTVLQSLLQREWGSAYYALTGPNTEVIGFGYDQ
jgi:prepilin-type N-terminal cleavage/methylation domain-containing protein/prepilin-type processing-associated H-X9-DG protein